MVRRAYRRFRLVVSTRVVMVLIGVQGHRFFLHRLSHDHVVLRFSYSFRGQL